MCLAHWFAPWSTCLAGCAAAQGCKELHECNSSTRRVALAPHVCPRTLPRSHSVFERQRHIFLRAERGRVAGGAAVHALVPVKLWGTPRDIADPAFVIARENSGGTSGAVKMKLSRAGAMVAPTLRHANVSTDTLRRRPILQRRLAAPLQRARACGGWGSSRPPPAARARGPREPDSPARPKREALRPLRRPPSAP